MRFERLHGLAPAINPGAVGIRGKISAIPAFPLMVAGLGMRFQ
jgi:hypothetical protein